MALSPRTARSLPITKANLRIILDTLAIMYPELPNFLLWSNAYQLMIAVILSAQTTDKQVNAMSPELFKRFGNPEALAKADIATLETLIHSCGFFRAKAKNIKAAAAWIWTYHAGEVPQTMDELVAIPGIGRKSAGVILHHVYQQAALIIDTHFRRVCLRLGLGHVWDPKHLEEELASYIPKEDWSNLSMRLNIFGREFCLARKPRCAGCKLLNYCQFEAKNNV